MTGFLPWTSGLGSDRSTDWATTTAHFVLQMFFCKMILCVVGVVVVVAGVAQKSKLKVVNFAEGHLSRNDQRLGTQNLNFIIFLFFSKSFSKMNCFLTWEPTTGPLTYLPIPFSMLVVLWWWWCVTLWNTALWLAKTSCSIRIATFN